MKKIIAVFALFACLTACKKTTETQLFQVDVLTPGNSADLFTGEYRSVALETHPDGILTDKTGKIVISDNKIYIQDIEQKAIFIFDDRGNYQSKISRFGRGHGEYVHINDFDVFDSKVYITSSAPKKVLVYSGKEILLKIFRWNPDPTLRILSTTRNCFCTGLPTSMNRTIFYCTTLKRISF